MILGASFDTVAENKAFAEKFSFPFLLLSDPERELGLAYGAADTPDAGYARRISYLIDPVGKVARVYDPVNPTSHPGQVLEDLAALMS